MSTSPPTKDIQMAFIKLITIVGGAATTAFFPMPSTKAKLVKDFLCLIYNHKSMMINTDETSYWKAYQQKNQYLNILMTSFLLHQNIHIMNILHFHQNIQIMNILSSLNSNGLLLPPCIVRTFDKSLTAVNIIKFTQEDKMKYLIIEHSSGNYYGFNLHESNKRTSAISIVQDQEEFMVMGWKVAKVIPTRVLSFMDWNNLMTSYNATPRQDVEMVNANDVFNANNVNVGNNDEVN
jgi:hypothetical protein